jgi:hypothetical protein
MNRTNDITGSKNRMCTARRPRTRSRRVKKALALYSFSEHGRRAYYGIFEDTTKVRVEGES